MTTSRTSPGDRAPTGAGSGTGVLRVDDEDVGHRPDSPIQPKSTSEATSPLTRRCATAQTATPVSIGLRSHPRARLFEWPSAEQPDGDEHHQVVEVDPPRRRVVDRREAGAPR